MVVMAGILPHCLVLIRLNFDHLPAEKLSMKKPDGFLILILFIFTGLSLIFYASYKSLNYFEDNALLKAKYERSKKLISLNNELESLKKFEKLVVRREPASLRPAPALGSEAAKEFYSKAKIACYEPLREMECIKDIELIVTQFPDSIWSAEALILLTDVYYQNNKTEKAKEIVKILKVQFKNFESIQGKVEFLEKQLL